MNVMFNILFNCDPLPDEADCKAIKSAFNSVSARAKLAKGIETAVLNMTPETETADIMVELVFPVLDDPALGEQKRP